MSEKYSPEFKQEAINLALNSEQSYRQIADDLGINYKTFCNWIYQTMNKSTHLGAAYTDSCFPGLIEYEYQIPAILSDKKVADMSNKAAQQAENHFKHNPDNRQYSVKVDSYWFQVTGDVKTGQINNVFITMPPRGSK